MLNRQACFEHAVSTIVRQKAWSAEMQETNWPIQGGMMVQCLYRDGKGCRCAVGSLIDDADYQPRMERKTASKQEVTAYIASRFGVVNQSRGDGEFLNALQRAVHDGLSYCDSSAKVMAPFSRDAVIKAALQFGNRQNLTTSFIDSLHLQDAA